jgi:hypothetical protein
VRAGTQVYPLFATTGVAVGICVMQLVRNITTNPEVRVTQVLALQAPRLHAGHGQGAHGP